MAIAAGAVYAVAVRWSLLSIPSPAICGGDMYSRSKGSDAAGGERSGASDYYQIILPLACQRGLGVSFLLLSMDDVVLFSKSPKAVALMVSLYRRSYAPLVLSLAL